MESKCFQNHVLLVFFSPTHNTRLLYAMEKKNQGHLLHPNFILLSVKIGGNLYDSKIKLYKWVNVITFCVCVVGL